MKETNPPPKCLLDPLVDRGNRIQELAGRHARLLVHMNIWQRPPSWIVPLQDQRIADWYALQMYCRVIRHSGLSHPLLDDTQPLDPAWLETAPLPESLGQETEQQLLARILYITSFSYTLSIGGYVSSVVVRNVGRWNKHVHELGDVVPGQQERKQAMRSAATFSELVAAILWTFSINRVPLRSVLASDLPSGKAANAWCYFLCLEDRAMVGYWFGSTTKPSLLDVVSGLFRSYSEGRYDECDPLAVRYHQELIRVMGQELYNRCYETFMNGVYPHRRELRETD
jgi:hypothetical protein